MKKFLAMILALCLFCSAAAFAATQNQQSTTKLTATISNEIQETYTLVIPATLNIAYGATETKLPITVANCNLKDGNQIKLSQNWDGSLKNGEKILPYTLNYNGKQVNDSTNAVTFKKDGTANLIVAISNAAWKNAENGTYNGEITFLASIVSK